MLNPRGHVTNSNNLFVKKEKTNCTKKQDKLKTLSRTLSVKFDSTKLTATVCYKRVRVFT